ncbi:aminoglycoside phosphotransferase family protein [Nocardiopsis sp. HNM0947]|uniref:Aminoglycoside phosphotransferase family protein n=1 Tax=Nocardiopsis coralli TaxID=2772213 RepID=A0ABR9P029_9ACTN|nr:aminoglycoside phosphotransferase family protein [Nocardiopsis coralli]MBE2997196.1 aminoglycoside phosphotransferase family protein [Nocardiopsis coralli]
MSDLNEAHALELAATFASSRAQSPHQARVLGPVGENATVHLPEEGVVLRISDGSQQRAQHELDISHWLAANGVNVVRAHSSRPEIVQGRAITVWGYLSDLEPGSPAAIGAALRSLHQVPEPVVPALPKLRPLSGVESYLSQSALHQEEQDYLLGQVQQVLRRIGEVSPALPPGPVHGDAHRKNIQQSSDRPPVLLDLERVSVGPREWDVIVPAVYWRVGWYSDDEYKQFVQAYGWDIREWSGFEVLATARELRMICWLSSRTGREPHLLTEARRRISSLEDPSARHAWSPGG